MITRLQFGNLTPEQELAYAEACQQFQRVYCLNLIAYNEFITAVDMLEESKRIRFVAKNVQKAEEEWQVFYGKMKTAMRPENFALLIDFSNEAYKPFEKKIAFFRGAACEYIAKGRRRTADMELASQLTVANTLFKASISIQRQLFDYFIAKNRIDFSLMFSYADMTKIVLAVERIISRLYPRTPLYLWNDATCVNAFDSITQMINNSKLFHTALDGAIDKNTVLSRRKTADRLSEKYNVKRL